jgi:hypothetical protein
MTRIIEATVFNHGHNELIGRLISALDVPALRELLTGLPVRLEPILEIQPCGGAIIPLHDRVAIRLDLKLIIPLSITVDSEGNYIPVVSGSAKEYDSAGEAGAAAASMSAV